MTSTPDLAYCERDINASRPSWSLNEKYVNQLHREIFSLTRGLEGWQAEGDTYKLFEMAYFAGEVILEIGTYAGRSAVVELRGALSNARRDPPPQYFGVDIDLGAIITTHNTLREHNLSGYAILFPGNVQELFLALPVTPTMVFVDGDHTYEGCQKDLQVLSGNLSAGTPVLCHDWTNEANKTGEYGVRRACDEWEEAGYGFFKGVFGCSALYVTTDRCQKPRARLEADQFQSLRQRSLEMLVNTCKLHGIPTA